MLNSPHIIIDFERHKLRDKQLRCKHTETCIDFNAYNASRKFRPPTFYVKCKECHFSFMEMQKYCKHNYKLLNSAKHIADSKITNRRYCKCIYCHRKKSIKIRSKEDENVSPSDYVMD